MTVSLLLLLVIILGVAELLVGVIALVEELGPSPVRGSDHGILLLSLR